jgi:hypothetical protein
VKINHTNHNSCADLATVNWTYPGGSWAVTHPKKALRVGYPEGARIWYVLPRKTRVTDRTQPPWVYPGLTQRSFTRIKLVLPHPIAKSAHAEPSSNTFTFLLGRPFDTLRRSLTDSAKPSRTSTVDSQLMHASVMLTPFFSPDGPSAGTFWLPSLIFDSIMTPIIEDSPARSWSPTTFATLGWFRWSLFELPEICWHIIHNLERSDSPCEQSIMIACFCPFFCNVSFATLILSAS